MGRLTMARVAGALAVLAVWAAAEDKLVFFDDFNQLDMRVWRHELTMSGGGNWEFQYYMNNRSTSYVRDGNLHLGVRLTEDVIGEACVRNGCTMDIWGSQPGDVCTSNAFYGCFRSSTGGNIINPVRSARVRTAESFSFRYGRVEVRAKLPRGDWLWPAIWMLPSNIDYGIWPASGEIDIMESRGNDVSYPKGGCNAFGSTLHFGPYFGADAYATTHRSYRLPSSDFSQDFHIFGLIWNTTNIITYVDDPANVVLNVNVGPGFYARGGWNPNTTYNPWESGAVDAPFDREFYLVMNVAVGGVSGYFPDGMGNKPWQNGDTAAPINFLNAMPQWYPTWTSPDMVVDWVKVWQTPSGSGTAPAARASYSCPCGAMGCTACAGSCSPATLSPDAPAPAAGLSAGAAAGVAVGALVLGTVLGAAAQAAMARRVGRLGRSGSRSPLHVQADAEDAPVVNSHQGTYGSGAGKGALT